MTSGILIYKIIVSADFHIHVIRQILIQNIQGMSASILTGAFRLILIMAKLQVSTLY